MGQKECRGFCEVLPDVLHRPWWKPRLVKYLYCPTCKKSFPDLRIYYKLDSKRRKTCVCCGTNLRTVPRRSKRWKESPLYKALEELPEPSSGQEDEELLRRLVLAKCDEDYRSEGDEDDD
ncbi:MAG: hypothetical protein J7K49_07075 [Thaumarchaeota archaeon]|nr:hypothetical protein [Nitrososphaerota archaeon]